MTQDINLSSIFEEVTKVMALNRQELDDADEYNHNHGTNMVNTFGLLQRAVESVKDQPVADQLDYASRTLREQSTSGTAQLYADGLAQASREFVGKELNTATAGTLVNALMGMGQGTDRAGGDFLSTLIGNFAKPKQEEPAPTQPDDLLGSLIGTMTGQQSGTTATQQPNDILNTLLGGYSGQKPPTQAQPAQPSQPGSDLLGSIFGGLTGQQQESPKPSSSGGIGDLISGLMGGGGSSSSSSGLADGIDAKDLISMGLAYYAAKQKGQSSIQAIMAALGSASPFGKRRDQTQSGALVVDTIMNMLGNR